MSINVTRSSMPAYEEYLEEIKELWDSHWLTNMGAKHRELETLLKEYMSVPNVMLYTNGHLALEHVIEAMNLPKGGEVITTPFTFASTTHAIVRNDLVPVFCDINPIDFTIDVTKMEALITDKTCAIVPVHVYGNICNVDEIAHIARKYELKVIYDAAHAFGVTYNNVNIANYGDASMFSFHATKVFNTIEGGAICYKADKYTPILRDLRNFGIRDTETVLFVGANAKMNEFQAAMGICNLRHLEEEIEKRKKVAERYLNHLENIEGLQFNPIQENVKPNYAYFPVIFEEKIFGSSRNEVFEALKEKGFGARKYFYPLTNTFECFHGKYDVNQTPIALHLSKRVLTLPLYADLAMEDVDMMCEIILNCKR